MIFKFSSDNDDNVINLEILRFFYFFFSNLTIISKLFCYLLLFFYLLSSKIQFRVLLAFFQFYTIIFSG